MQWCSWGINVFNCKKPHYITTLSKIRSYVSHALFRDVHWVIPPAKKTSKPTTVLLGWHAWGQTRHLQQQISSLPLSLWPKSELSPHKNKWEEIGDVVESKSNKLKKSEHSPLLLDIETFEFPKWRYQLMNWTSNIMSMICALTDYLVINEPNTFSKSGNCNRL